MTRNPLHPHVIPIRGTATHYEWGPPASVSAAARLHCLNHMAAIESAKPCSEFVISTHPSHGTAVLASNPTVSLRDHILTQVIEVDANMVDFYARLHADGVPYILKIVSVQQPQNLRVHPGEGSLKQLAAEDPLRGVDSIPKALMIVALGDVELLFGFQSAQDIIGELLRVPEFADAIGRPKADRFVHIAKTAAVKRNHIRELVENLLLRKREFIRKCLEATTQRFEKMPAEAVTENDMQLIALQKLHPDDPMCFAVYFLNRLKLETGNAVFIHPQEPYSILSGDYIEASTYSDYTIAGGLTSDAVDMDSFLDSLSYDDSTVEVSDGERFSEYGISYVPPVPQFQLLDFKLPADISQQMMETIAPSMMLVLQGEGTITVDEQNYLLPLVAGSVYYLNPQTSFTVNSQAAANSLLHFIQIGVNESAAPNGSSPCSVM